MSTSAESWLPDAGITVAYDGDGNRVSETIGGTTTKFLVDNKNPTKLPQVMDELVNGVHCLQLVAPETFDEAQRMRRCFRPICSTQVLRHSEACSFAT